MASQLQNIIGRCRPGGLSQGDLKKELANRKAKIEMDGVSAKSPFKTMIDRWRPGRLSQGDLKKELANRKAKIKMDRVSAKSPFSKHDRWMLAGKAKPRGTCKKS